MRVVIVLFSTFFALPALAWDGYTHTLLVERGLKATAESLQLHAPVVITPYAQFLKKMSPVLGIAPTPAAFAQFLRVNPTIDIAAMGADEVDGMRWPPFKIMAVHVNDPDDGRDKNVVTKPTAKWMGGPESQAFRHFEKPAWQWGNLPNTLSFPFGELGEASLRTQIYFDLARLAWQLDEPYWAWRWLGCALHYLQDLSQPYHTVQDNSHGRYLVTGMLLYLQHFGRTGFVDTMIRILSNSHLFYEALVSSHTMMAMAGRPRDARCQQFLDAMDGDAGTAVADIHALAKSVRTRSNEVAADLLATVHAMSNARLRSLYHYPQPGDYAEFFLKTPRDLDMLAAEERYFTISGRMLGLGAEGTRSLVATFHADRGNETPATLVPTLRKMLEE